MNDIIQAMETRRSIRQFKPDMPRREEIFNRSSRPVFTPPMAEANRARSFWP